MSTSIVKRQGTDRKLSWWVLVENGRAPARHCPGVELRSGKVRRHRAWVDEHTGDECPTCGQELGPVTQERRRHWHGPYKTKKAASDQADRLGVAVTDGMYAAPTSITLREFLEERWLPAMAAQYRPSTFAGYRSNITNHVIPRFGAMQLRAIGPEHLNKFYGELLEGGKVVRKGRARTQTGGGERKGGLHPTTVAGVHKILHRALRDACRWRLIARNPADDADAPRARRSEMKYWSPEQLRTFVEHDPDDRLAGLWHLVATTGMRRGELAGLRWDAVDLDAGRLSVVSTITVGNYTTHVGEPKTRASRRVIALDPSTVAALKHHRDSRQKRERVKAGPAWSDTDYVFTSELGEPLHPQTISYAFERRVKAAGLPPIRLHDVRHSYAVAALSAGEHPKAMQERLGHSSATVTLDVYSHVTEGVSRDTANRVAALILGQ
jgi:integrase